MRRIILVFLAALCLLLSGCSLLEKEYSVVEPHSDRYWESTADDILRAESYQDLVNTTLLLVEGHEPDGTIRLYLSDMDYDTAWSLVYDACYEVRTQTAIGAYSLRSLDFNMEKLLDNYYEVQVLPAYRRTQEEVTAIAETASSGAIYDMVLRAWEEGADHLTVRYTYLSEDEATLRANILLLQQDLEGSPAPPETEPSPESPNEDLPAEETEAGEETDPEDSPPDGSAEDPPAPDETPAEPPALTPWEINFYPPGGDSSIIEIFF